MMRPRKKRAGYQETLSRFVVVHLKGWVGSLNALGVPLPMVRDPKTGSGSVTLTMTVMSFTACLMGQIGKISNLLGNVDLSQANYLFLMCLGAYLGRRMQDRGVPAKREPAKKSPEPED